MKNIDKGVFVIAVIISFIGLAMIYSTGGLNYFLRQALWLAFGAIVSLIMAKLPSRIWATFALPLYILTCLLTLEVLF